jgi:hypothetical protein
MKIKLTQEQAKNLRAALAAVRAFDDAARHDGDLEVDVSAPHARLIAAALTDLGREIERGRPDSELMFERAPSQPVISPRGMGLMLLCRTADGTDRLHIQDETGATCWLPSEYHGDIVTLGASGSATYRFNRGVLVEVIQ